MADMTEETHRADPSPYPDADKGGVRHDHGPAPGTPRWVTVVGIAGPHMHGAGLGGYTPASRVTAQGLPHR